MWINDTWINGNRVLFRLQKLYITTIMIMASIVDLILIIESTAGNSKRVISGIVNKE